MIEKREYEIVENVRKTIHAKFPNDPRMLNITMPLWKLTHEKRYLSKELLTQFDEETREQDLDAYREAIEENW